MAPEEDEKVREESESDHSFTQTGGALTRAQAPTAAAGEEEALVGILHDLNNVLVCVLLNAQIMAQKLPSYSRLRRNLHEVERSAQRGGVLVRRLRNWFQNGNNLSRE